MVQIIIGSEIASEVESRLRQGALEGDVTLLKVDPQGRGDALEGADAALRSDLNADGLRYVLDHAPRLRWFHSTSAGVESWPIDELHGRGIALTNAAGVFAIPIAEWVMTAMLMSVKRAHAMHDAQREHRWANGLDLDELMGKTLLILGIGGIGREVARRAAAFGMRIWGANRSGGEVEHVDRVVSGDEWRSLLPEADFVVMTLPLTSETQSMIGAAELQRLKPGAWLLNVGRGATIDEPALMEALQTGQIGGAAIDAWIEEPLPPDHAAWSIPNLIIWPHHSGASPRNRERNLDLFVDNLRRFKDGQELLNVVDPEAGY